MVGTLVAFLLYRDLSMNNTTKWVLCLLCWPTHTHGTQEPLRPYIACPSLSCLYFCLIYWIRLDLGLGLGLFYSLLLFYFWYSSFPTRFFLDFWSFPFHCLVILMLVEQRGFNYEVLNKQKETSHCLPVEHHQESQALGALICLRWSLITPNQLALCYGNLDDAAAAIND